MYMSDLTIRVKFNLVAISHAIVLTYKVASVNNLQRGGISDLHKLRYCHLVTTSRQMPKRMKDRAEQLTNSPKEILINNMHYFACQRRDEE